MSAMDELRKALTVQIERAEVAEARLAATREALDAMQLHDSTGDPHDVGYMAAVNELRAALVSDRDTNEGET